ncbi:MAG TPA: TraY domain-containing protein [Candidatus Binataceae bacterium]|nr:TraY domain-containing protein [Candidatus Binataceae bacterium]
MRLPKDLERRLEKLARKTGRTKSYYARQAIEEFLEEREDYLLGVSVIERMERGEEPTISLRELQKRLGLDG